MITGNETIGAVGDRARAPAEGIPDRFPTAVSRPLDLKCAGCNPPDKVAWQMSEIRNNQLITIHIDSCFLMSCAFAFNHAPRQP
jgi:hypothetical protein